MSPYPTVHDNSEAIFQTYRVCSDVIFSVSYYDFYYKSDYLSLEIYQITSMASPLQENQFVFSKELFISFKKENPNDYYDIDPTELGKGAFGTVYKGRVAGSEGSWRAVKKIEKNAITNTQMPMDEIQFMITLDHPSVIKLYDIFQWKSAVYLVTDFCDGGQLFDKLEQVGSFSQQNARVIFRQMMEGINYVHHKNIAHRDLKPENFLFLGKDSMNLKLIDFGLAYRWEQDMQSQLRKKGEKKLVGTSYYLSPQVAKFQYDQRCDIWSAGVILYMLVSATPPFDGQTDKQIINNVKQLQYSMEIPEFDSITNQLKDLIRKILVPAEERISISQIFEHPWMKIEIPNQPLNINFHKMAAFSKFSKLKKLSAIYIASQCSQKQVERLGDIFRQIDIDKNGTISIEQLKLALQSEKDSAVLHHLKQMMDSIDTDKDGTINYTQFLASVMNQDQIFSQKNLKMMFSKLDIDGNGTIQKEELMQLFQENGVEENGKSLKQIIESCDYDGDGKITFEQFKKSMLE